MKKHYLFSILFAAPFMLLAQNAPEPKASLWQPSRGYIQFNVGGNNDGKGVYLHFNNRWVAFASFGKGTVKPQQLPKDYQPWEHKYFNGVKEEFQPPQERHSNYVIGMGRVLTPAAGKAWVMVTGGLSYTKYTSQVFTRQERLSSPLYDYDLGDFLIALFSFGLVNTGELVGNSITSNYTSVEKQSSGIGGSLGVQANLNLFRFMGLNGGGTVYINHGRFIPVANLGVNMGIMRPAKKATRKGI